MPLRHRTGWSDGAVHLIGPVIFTVQPMRKRCQMAFRIALIENDTGFIWIIFNRFDRIGQIGQCRRSPRYLQRIRRFYCLFFTFRDDTDEVTNDHDIDKPRNMSDRVPIHFQKGAADERAVVVATIGRTHHPGVQHPGDPHIMHVDHAPCHLVGDVHARHLTPDNTVFRGRLHRRFFIQFQPYRDVTEEITHTDGTILL